ncbi:cytidylate kinase [Deferribacter desulfuricans SSM1]|uniref:Cytidylate kinase n=1 Tax=Deferribacter desulfuricans (strain DSM 14783 / JCM 11476 / NBRC 101012 / SSM1) TaxID=639282 RepID=D3PA05_DEFDS|nr:(d)CMP kinase [Deferribacter desulfuricans]BAI81545.1 cytidylate kinase [Deferribacter desulfuricans SSM1]
MKSVKKLRIAIDGPAGSGKSTIAKILAKLYNLIYIDTGAMYRYAAYLYLKNNQNLDIVINMLKESEFNFVKDGETQKLKVDFHGESKLYDDELRTVDVSKIVSKVAKNKDIRIILTEKQKEIAKNNSVIMDGRDIGTVVIPEAEVKVFLSATPEERAKRRLKDYETKGIKISYEEVLEDIKKRDEEDVNRDIAPLKKADDAYELDTTGLSIDDVVRRIKELIDKVY